MPFTDLSGLFHIQQNYLAGLSINDASFNTKITNLQSNLSTLNGAYGGAIQSSSAVLAKQSEMSNLVDIEKQRLELKKQNIDNALVVKNRSVQLNDTYRMRQAQYLRIKVAFVSVLAIVIGITLLNRRYPIVPQTVISLIIIIVIFVGILYSIFVYSSIVSRSLMNYNELDLAGPSAPTAADVIANQVAAGKAGDLLGTINVLGCSGAECCDTGTIWNNVLSKCVPDATTSPSVNGFTTMGLPHAFSPSEYDSYGKV
jgi:hypothetical protein